MAQYEKGYYTEACKFFSAAIEADGTNFLAHYNLACTMTLLREKYNPCDFDPERKYSFDIRMESILEHLRIAAELNPGRKHRMLEDPDLRAVHTALEFHLIAGRSMNTAADARIILQEVLWRIDFPRNGGQEDSDYPDGVINFAPDGIFGIDFWGYEIEGYGRYRVENGLLELFFTGGDFGTGTVNGVFDKDRIVINGLGKRPLIIWNDTKDCPAFR